MATYIELHDLVGAASLSDVRKRIRVALTVKAQAIAAAGASTDSQKEWARSALGSVSQYEETVVRYLLALNRAATVAAITSAADEGIQTAVDAAVNTLLAP